MRCSVQTAKIPDAKRYYINTSNDFFESALNIFTVFKRICERCTYRGDMIHIA